MIVYNVHNKIVVRLHGRLPAVVIDCIDSQIGYFRSEHQGPEPAGSVNLNIMPFDARPDIRYKRGSILSGWGICDGNVVILKRAKWGLAVADDEWSLFIGEDSVDINAIIQLILFRMDLTFVHAAAVENRNRVFLFTSFPGGGKTALTGRLMKLGSHTSFLGDDLVILSSDGACLAYPRSLMLYKYHVPVYPEVLAPVMKKVPGHAARNILKSFVKENIPFKGVMKRIFKNTRYGSNLIMSMRDGDCLAKLPARRVFKSERISKGGRIEEVVLMKRWQGDNIRFAEVEREELINSMFSTVHHEWVNVWEQALILGGFNLINLSDYYRKTFDNLEKGLSQVKISALYVPDRYFRDKSAEIANTIRDRFNLT